MVEHLDGVAAEPSLWESVPDLVSLEIATWEHSVLVPKSWGKADRVNQLQRLLPHELTDPIYDRMEQAEALFLRRTEPLPPLQERLARDFAAQNMVSQSELQTSDGAYRLTLEGELQELLQTSNTKLNDITPNWDAVVATALGANAAGIEQKAEFGSLGLPKGEYSVAYGYRIYVRRIKGSLLGPQMANHGALLMGCVGPNLQPGPLRDFVGMLLR
jgi:hypothetical protein